MTDAGRTITACVVDDEPLAREGLAALLESDPEIDVVAICAGGRDAVAAIADSSPDLLFLDVQMPEMDGFAVLRHLGTVSLPFIIFTTAYDTYALDAFEEHAIEYLLKPYTDERLGEAVSRAKTAVRERRMARIGENVFAMLAGLETNRQPGPSGSASRIAIRSGGTSSFVSVDDIDWIEGADYYAKLHVRGRMHLVRESLASLEGRLDPRRFFRAHRSAILNVERVREIQAMFNRESVAVLLDGTKVRLARGKRGSLENLLEGRNPA